MSDDQLPVIGSGAALPAHLQQYQDKIASTADMVTSYLGLPALSIRGKQFHYIKDDKEVDLQIGEALNVVILASDPPGRNVAKSYYGGAYVEGNAEQPDCASSDGIRPDSYIESPKCRSCNECEFNEWGSGRDAAGQPTKGKACSDHKNLFLVHANDVNGPMCALRVPATSLKAMSAYAKSLTQNKVPMQAVVTQLSFANTTHPQLEFKGVNYLSQEDTTSTMARSESEELLGALPSKNQTAPADDVDALPAPPDHVKELSEPLKEMTDKATVSYEKYVDAGWSDEQLVKGGLMTITNN